MSDRLYTCDICIREGHEEVGCHSPNELIQVGENVVCQGCLECGEFPELDDLPQEPFVPSEDKLIAALQAEVKEWQHWMGLAITEREEIIEQQEAENAKLTARVEELESALFEIHKDYLLNPHTSNQPERMATIAANAINKDERKG